MIAARLRRSETLHRRRQLPPPLPLLDFCSNDYLGFATSGHLVDKLRVWLADHETQRFGSTGSRLLSGNSAATEHLEKRVRLHHKAAAALLFNSGYDANLGLFSALPRDAQIFYDEQVHASIKDGIALSRAWAQPFRHNDLEHLERRLQRATKPVFVGIEALYSMDGQMAPLTEIIGLCERYDAALIVDEAHSAGIYGASGAGLISALGFEAHVFARVITYGKAFGCQGACVLGSDLLKEYLINYAHSFIYSTALPSLTIQAISAAYELMELTESRDLLISNIAFFRNELDVRGLAAVFLPSSSAIQGVLLPETRAAEVASTLADKGYDVKAIRSPTVRRGTERLRICLHSFNDRTSARDLITELVSLV